MTLIEDQLTYDPDTGMFKWLEYKPRRMQGWFKGSLTSNEAGRVKRYSSYCIRVNGTSYRTGRLAWYLMKGEWPMVIDHINRNPTDNRWFNLRNVTPAENTQNQRGKGWSKRNNNYQAQIRVNGKKLPLGTYKTEEEAHAAYLKAKVKYHPHYAANL